MTREVTMETKVSDKQFYFSEKPIVISDNHSLGNDEPNQASDLKLNGQFSFATTARVSRKILRWMTLGDRRHSQFMRQVVLLKRNPKHVEAIDRCLHYGNKIPRKYKRAYKEVIKRVKMPWQR